MKSNTEQTIAKGAQLHFSGRLIPSEHLFESLMVMASREVWNDIAFLKTKV